MKPGRLPPKLSSPGNLSTASWIMQPRGGSRSFGGTASSAGELEGPFSVGADACAPWRGRANCPIVRSWPSLIRTCGLSHSRSTSSSNRRSKRNEPEPETFCSMREAKTLVPGVQGRVWSWWIRASQDPEAGDPLPCTQCLGSGSMANHALIRTPRRSVPARFIKSPRFTRRYGWSFHPGGRLSEATSCRTRIADERRPWRKAPYAVRSIRQVW